MAQSLCKAIRLQITYWSHARPFMVEVHAQKRSHGQGGNCMFMLTPDAVAYSLM